jgi:hypothetical protein
LAPVLRREEPLAKNHSEGELVSWWNDLAAEDARRAYAAIWRLTESPSVAVALLRRHLKPAADADMNAIRQLIAGLDHDDFATREKAFEQLKRMSHAAESPLRHALEKNSSLEARRRIQLLLERLTEQPASGESLRVLRALAVLEQTGAEGRRLLRELAAGPKETWMTAQANASLARCLP